MIPRYLRVQAFGPFPGEQQVDFSRLLEAGIFLINGPTGSGKSSLLDAMSFALYGQTATDDRDAVVMRSDRADGEVPTEVEFQFSLGEQAFRVLRQPRQTLTKRSGDGTTDRPSRLEITRIRAGFFEEGGTRAGDDDCSPLDISGVSDGDAFLRDLTGLDIRQFRQVMVLPQGKFRELLIADSRTRQEILSHLFQGSMYRNIEDRFKKLSDERRKAGEDLRLKSSTLLQSGNFDSIQELTEAINQLELSIPKLESTGENLRNRYDAASRKLYQAQEREKARTQHRKNREELAGLEARSGEMAMLRQRHASALAAAGLVTAYETLKREEERSKHADVRLAQAKQFQERSARELANCLGEAEEVAAAAAGLETLETEQRQLEQLASNLEARRLLSKRIEEHQLELNRTGNMLVELQAKHHVSLRREEDLRRITALKGSLDSMSEALSYARELHEEQEALQIRVEHLNRESLARKAELGRVRDELAQTQTEEKACSKALEAARKQFEHQRAAELAAGLKDGQPCPVCGSIHHPSPAEFDTLLPDLAALERVLERSRKTAGELVSRIAVLQQQEDSAEGQREEFASRLAELNNRQTPRLAQLAEMAGDLATLNLPSNGELTATGDFPSNGELTATGAGADSLDSTVRDMTTFGGQLAANLSGSDELPLMGDTGDLLNSMRQIHQRLVEQLPEPGEAISRDQIETEIEQQRRLGQGAEVEMARLSAELQALEQGDANGLAQQRSLGDADAPSLRREAAARGEQIAAIRQRREVSAQKLEAARRELAVRENELEQAGNAAKKQDAEYTAVFEAWEKDREASGFATDSAFLEARQSGDTSTEWGRTLREYEQRLELLRDKIAEYDGSNETDDLQALTQDMDMAREEFDRADSQLKESLSKQTTWRNLSASLEDISRQQKVNDDEYRLYGSLAEAATGKNSRNLSFQRYVLSVLLDDVLYQASLRLLQMSSGRYRLYRRPEASRGGKAAGLELEVDDAYSGRRRPVNTLSGGESFLASLSLALGLSDVVQSHAGAVRLDTLFIDEGFGSLDAETLERALEAITELHQNGRIIGLISHVGEIREQIRARIDITPTPDRGSSITIRG